jgi:voltage-gated potassium channel Kch
MTNFNFPSSIAKSMKSSILVSALGRTGYKIYSLLKKQGANVVGINPTPIITQPDDHIIIGDLTSPQTLIKAGIKQAEALVLTSNDDSLNVAILTQARILNPKIRIINRLYNHTLGKRLDKILPDHLSMSVSALASPIFVFAALGSRAIGHLRLFEQNWALHEEIIGENHPWLGLEVGELWDDIERMLIYYLPSKSEIDLVSAVVEGKRLELGDHLIVATKPKPTKQRTTLRSLQKWLKPLFNINTYREHGRPLIIVTFTLLVTIFLATFTYLCFNWNIPIADAIYFSVGMITGAGGKEEVAEQAPDLIKFFTAIMMIVGAGVIGICYALINDFVLGSRLKQFWDAARVPTHNHYIICGLGGIGMEIIKELYQQKQEVVVIESDSNNRFLHSARSLGIPVIVGDATLAENLKATNINRAKAIISVTSNDMVNVEIGLTAKALRPKLPVILRIHDSQFAESTQQVFQFETVLSPTELATYSFAAAALGGRILGNGMTEDLLWVALATMITPNHPFCGKTVQEKAIASDFVPLYLQRNEEMIHSWHLLNTYLREGDILYLTMPATKLEQLWRKNSSPPIALSVVNN